MAYGDIFHKVSYPARRGSLRGGGVEELGHARTRGSGHAPDVILPCLAVCPDIRGCPCSWRRPVPCTTRPRRLRLLGPPWLSLGLSWWAMRQVCMALAVWLQR